MFQSELSSEDYFTLAHSADQTHAGDCKSEQGYQCMDIVDTDRYIHFSLFCQMTLRTMFNARCEKLKELGYSVTLSKLQPTNCTPKNNLIVASLSETDVR